MAAAKLSPKIETEKPPVAGPAVGDSERTEPRAVERPRLPKSRAAVRSAAVWGSCRRLRILVPACRCVSCARRLLCFCAPASGDIPLSQCAGIPA